MPEPSGIRAAVFPASRLRFGDDLEPYFTKYHLEHSLPFARFALILAVLLYALFGILDFFIVPDAARWIWLIRYAIFCPAALIVLGLTFTRWFKPVIQPILAGVAALAGLGIVAMIAIAHPSAGYLYYAGLLLVIPWAYTVLQLRFSYATRACLAIIIGYEIVAVWLEPTPIQILINNNFFFLSAVIIGMVAGYTIERGLRTDFLQRRLIEAQRAELAVHNAQLDSELQKSLDGLRRQAAELQASRARIVSAADGERRRIERNLHDGAQQLLTAIAVKLRLVSELGEQDRDMARNLLAEANSEINDAARDLRDLAHGIYPPLLAESGLPTTLATAARRSTMPTTVDAGTLGRYPAEVEATVYFCCLEAIQNASKHAGEGRRSPCACERTRECLPLTWSTTARGSMSRAAGWAPVSSTWPIDWALSEAACGWNRPRSEAPRCRGRSRRRRALTPDKGHQRHTKYQPVTSGVLFIDRSAALTGDLRRMAAVAAAGRHQRRASRG